MGVGVHVSFVVIAYNEAQNIDRTLDTICNQSGLDSYEVIVVNDGSRDSTASIVAARARCDPRIRLIDLVENRGRGYARHTGVAAAVGELIATVDADITLPHDWLVRAEAALLTHDAVGGTAVPDGDASYVYQAFKLIPRIVGHATTVTGSNALYRRQVFELVEFDASLREGEDVALNQARIYHELSFVTVPGLLVEHLEHKRFLQSLGWLFVSGKGATRQFLTYRKVRMPDIATLAFWTSVAGGALIVACGSPIIGLVVPIAVLLGISAEHIRSRFHTPRSRWVAIMAATAINSSLMLAYFAGRLVGLVLPKTWGKASVLRRSLAAQGLGEGSLEVAKRVTPYK